jgi:glycosyltransferase involved in cell wall biosynthesis
LVSPSSVSILIFTLNEEENLPRCLDSIKWCDDIVVVDSFSTDATVELCETYSVRYVQHEFKGFGTQRNWSLDNIEIKHEWVLILDADERVPPSLAAELNELAETTTVDFGAYRLKRRFHLWGRWLRFSSLYPTWVVRFIRQGRVRYVDRGHLIDENVKGISAWFARQNQYSDKDAQFELGLGDSESSSPSMFSSDPLRRRAAIKRYVSRLPCRGSVYFVYCYFFRLGFLDGRDGLMFCRMKAMYQIMVDVKKYDLRKGRH